MGVPGAGAGVAEFVAGPRRCPCGFGGVGVAEAEQEAVGHAADVRAVDRAEGGQGLVPRGAKVRVVRGGFGADRVGGVVVTGQLPVGTDRRGPALPFQPGFRIGWDLSQDGDCPGKGGGGGVLADAFLAGVHERRDLGEVRGAFGVTDTRGPGRTRRRPGAGPERRCGGGCGS